MSKKFMINKEKTLNSALFVLEQLGGSTNLHKLFKILYFADQKHLVKFGVPISGDYYIAMQDGPVPSKLYDVFKFLRDGDNGWPIIALDCHAIFDIQGRHTVIAKQQPDLDELSESNLNCLLESVKENKNLGYGDLKTKSHKTAWEAAKDNEMDALEIALEGGATSEMIEYIKTNLENHIIFENYAKFG